MLAAALSVCASVGLHKEPAGAFRDHATPGLHPPAGAVSSTSHTCLLCLLYGSVSLASAVALPRATLAARFAPPCRTLLVDTLSAALPYQGRAPPTSV